MLLLLPLKTSFLVGLFLVLFNGSDGQSGGICTHLGTQYRNGQEWIVSHSFIMKCAVHYNRWETKIVACLSMLGERFPVHGQITDQHGTWKCVQDSNGSTRLVKQK